MSKTHIITERYTLIQGDCLEELRTMAARSIHCVITSPPYYGLRDYGHDGQIGLEETPEQYVARLVAVFRELWRVLRDDGVVFLNLGDSYAGSNRRSGEGETRNLRTDKFHGGRAHLEQRRTVGNFAGLKPKDLIGIPWRVAFALQADGWYLRQDIIWHKPNPMPESVTDRCTKAHEYVFLLTKSARYWYDNEAVKEGFADSRMGNPGGYKWNYSKGSGRNDKGLNASGGIWNENGNEAGRNRRSVWTVATQPYSGAHFATFPPKLIEPMVLAGCPAQCCPTCGKGWERVVERSEAMKSGGGNTIAHADGPMDRGGKGQWDFGAIVTTRNTTTLGFRPACNCGNTTSVAGVVLDPFNGSGTTGEVALLNGRRYVGIELSADYMELSRERVGAAEEVARNAAGDFTTTARERASGQLSLFDAGEGDQ